MLQMEDHHWKIVQAILKKYPYTFYAFGSRVYGHPRPLSDLDLCYIEPIPTMVLSQLEEEFTESDLPFTVDLVDWNLADEPFKKKIQTHWLLLKKE